MAATLPTALDAGDAARALQLAGGAIRSAQHRLGRLRAVIDLRAGHAPARYVVLPTESSRVTLASARAALVEAVAQVDALAAQLGEAGA